LDDQKQFLKHIIWSYKCNLRQEEHQPDYVLVSSVLQQEVTQQRLSWWWLVVNVSFTNNAITNHMLKYTFPLSSQLYINSPHQFNLI